MSVESSWKCSVKGYSKALLQKLCFTNEIICVGTSLPGLGEENWKWLSYFVVWPDPKPSLCMRPANSSGWLTTRLRASQSLLPLQETVTKHVTCSSGRDTRSQGKLNQLATISNIQNKPAMTNVYLSSVCFKQIILLICDSRWTVGWADWSLSEIQILHLKIILKIQLSPGRWWMIHRKCAFIIVE